jgi:maleylpyruvate isomerase
LKSLADGDAAKVWARDTIAEGLAACAALIAGKPGPYSFGADVTLADILLIPQIANARRFDAPVSARLLDVEQACLALDAFRRALPENQPDAE